MNKEARAAGRRLLPVYVEVDAGTREAAERASCRRGCHHCCYNLAAVSVLEAVPIAEYLLTSDIWKPKLKKLRADLSEQAGIIDNLGGVGNKAAVAWLDLKIPCVFLKKNGECGIYSLRPMVCRTYYVVSPPEDCSPDRNQATVAVVDFQTPVLQFWAHMMMREAAFVPPAVDSFQRSVLIAFELLERGKDGLESWMRENNVSLDILGSLKGLQAFI